MFQQFPRQSTENEFEKYVEMTQKLSLGGSQKNDM